jgi:lipopolysaccharide export system permease protein
MIPLIWTSILRNYFKSFILSNAIFASILVLVRVYEIARFATLGGGILNLILFTILQFPFILPLAIPISCMIASIGLTQKMSQSSELTSLRSFGFSILNIFKPIIYCSILFCAANSYLVYSITPSIKQVCKNLMIKVSSENPLTIIQNGRFSLLNHSIFNYKIHRSGSSLDDLFLAIKTDSNRIHLFQIDHLTDEKTGIKAKNVDGITHFKKEQSIAYPVIEHYQTIVQPSESLPQLLFNQKRSKLVAQKLSLKSLIDLSFDKTASKKKRNEAIFEIARRIYLSLGPFVLTLIGLSFSIDISRRPSKYYKLLLFFASLTYFLIYLTAKGFKSEPYFLIFYLLFGLVFLSIWSIFHLKKMEKGIESWI